MRGGGKGEGGRRTRLNTRNDGVEIKEEREDGVISGSNGTLEG